MNQNEYPITFEYDGVEYKVPMRAFDIMRMVLPDGRLLDAPVWLESSPPIPKNLTEINHVFTSETPEKIAELMNAVVAVRA